MSQVGWKVDSADDAAAAITDESLVMAGPGWV